MEKVGGFDETMDGWEDYDFWWRLSKNGFSGKRLPLPLFNYRHIRESVSTLANTKQKELYNHIFNKPSDDKNSMRLLIKFPTRNRPLKFLQTLKLYI